jgi:hypothetical protein
MINQLWLLQLRLDCVKTFASLHILCKYVHLEIIFCMKPRIFYCYIQTIISFNELVQMLQTYMYMHIHTPLHTYAYIHTYIYIYTYTCALVQANFLNRHYIYKYDMVANRGYQLRNERKSSRIQWVKLNVILQLKTMWPSKSMVK